jgi:hypothetical protein
VTTMTGNEIVPASLKKYPLRERCEVAMNFACYIFYNSRMKYADYDIITRKSNTHQYVKLNAENSQRIG